MENYQDINIDNEFWSDFTLEAFEHIEDIERNVLTLEKEPENMEIIHTMFRAFHTIKGLSGFVEHTVIQEIAHKTETLMDFCRKGELSVSHDIVNAILKSSDFIRRLCEDVDAFRDEAFIAVIIKHVEVLESLLPVKNIKAEEVEVQLEPAVEQEVPQDVESRSVENLSDEAFFDFVEENKEEENPASIEEQVFEEEFAQVVQDPVAKESPLDSNEEELELSQSPESIENSDAEQNQEPVSEIESGSLEEPAAQDIELKEVKVAVEPETVQKPSFEQKPETEKFVSKDFVPVKKPVSSNEEYMKVANSKIDHLVETIGELIINQALIDQYIDLNYSQDNKLITSMSGFSHITRELQNLSMFLRMVSLKSTFQKITRIARDTIQELGKDIEFVVSGDSTEIDRVVAEKLLDPLVHLIKNAISHGVEEDVQDRIKNNKNPKARVELNAYNKRGKIYIEVKDDGRGINTEIVYQKAVEKGIINPNHTYTEEEIKEFILLPGFSTAQKVDNISGRGVGMDVVKTQIAKISGKIDIKSELNKGSTFTLEVPVNHAIMNGTVIEINEHQFIVPTMNVKEILQPQPNQWISTQQKQTMLKVRDNIVPIVPTSMIFGSDKKKEKVPLVILLELDQEYRALPIDNVLNRQEVVVKPVSEEFSKLKYISGMSILGSGRVSLILDVDYLFTKEVKE